MNGQYKKSRGEASQQTIEFFEKVLRASIDGIVITDVSHTIIIVNEAFCNLFDRQRCEVVETNLFFWLEKFGAEGPKRWAEMEDSLYRKGSCHGVEFTLTTREGVKYLSVNASIMERVRNDEAGIIISIWRDITGQKHVEEKLRALNRYLEQCVAERTAALVKVNEELRTEIAERKRIEEKITYVAFHDVLTSLPNRMLFYDRLTLALAHAQRSKEMLAVMFLDLDRFKTINDTLGHTTGDQLLRDVAGKLKKSVREEDTVARLGGDEFTLIVSGIFQVEHAGNIACKILDTIKQPLIIAGHELCITTSIGIALYPDDGNDPETLLKNADIAMYYAKQQGRNNYQFYTSDMNPNSNESEV